MLGQRLWTSSCVAPMRRSPSMSPASRRLPELIADDALLPADLADRGRFPRHRRALHAGGGADARLAASSPRPSAAARVVPHMLAAMLGLAAVLHTSAVAFAALKWCGLVFLLYMAWQACAKPARRRSRARPGGAHAGADRHRLSVTSSIRTSIFFRLPAAVIAADEAPPLRRMLDLSGAFMAMTFAAHGLRCSQPRSATASSHGQADGLAGRSLPAALPRSG